MESTKFDSFCGSRFWDDNVTWHTEDPQLTPCFQKTVLIWIPCFFLWAFGGFFVCQERTNRTRKLPWTFLNISKSIGIALLICLEIADLSAGHHDGMADDVGSVVLLLTFVLALSLVWFSKMRGIHTSGVLFIFWLQLMVFGIPAFRYQIHMTENPDGIQDVFHFVKIMIYYPLVVYELILHCFADFRYGWNEGDANKMSPEETASFPSLLSFLWFEKLIWRGYRRPLDKEDLWNLDIRDRSDTIVPPFEKQLQTKFLDIPQNRISPSPDSVVSFTKSTSTTEFAKVDNKKEFLSTKKQIHLFPIFCRTFGSAFGLAAILKLHSDVLNFASPQILKLLIAYVQGNEENWKGFFYALLLFIAATVQVLILGQYFQIMFRMGMNMRTALISSIFRKALKISNSSRKESTVGEIVNLMSTDVQKIMEVMPYIHMFWSAPFQIALGLYFLWTAVGPSALAGLAVMVLMIPINAVVSQKVEALHMKEMTYKDERIKLMSEILNGIKVLKLYAWEPSFLNKISDIRSKEISVLKKTAFLNAVLWFFWTGTLAMVTLVTFVTYISVDRNNILDAGTVFFSLSIFNVMLMPMGMLPYILVLIGQARVSLIRINKFLNLEELRPDNVQVDSNEDAPVIVENGTFSWDAPEGEPCLRNINFRIKEGGLVAIVGPIASGKSSLLSAILGELEKISGRVVCKSSIAYVQQQAWIQNATLQDNILFGAGLDSTKYSDIIEACALKPDLEILPAGDNTEIGEKGINLSGGQKQRVSLARAVYADADMYLLDDPLSAVDTHVGKHIFDNVIGPEGILQEKTRILVTHALTYLPRMDQIVVMNNGEISEMGTYRELLQRKGRFAEFLLEHVAEGSEGAEEIALQLQENAVNDEQFQQKLIRSMSIRSGGSANLSNNSLSMEQSTRPNTAGSTNSNNNNNNNIGDKSSKSRRKSRIEQIVANGKEIGAVEKDTLIEEENAETGSVKLSVYFYYMKSAGVLVIVTGLIFQSINHALSVGSHAWLSLWSDEHVDVINGTHRRPSERYEYFLAVYIALSFSQGIAVMIASLVINTGFLVAARIRHDSMLHNILRSPMSFFDTTPLGRIINRFSGDVHTVDNTLPNSISEWLHCVLESIGTVVVIGASTPMFLAVIVPVGIAYYFIQKVYVASSRQLKRLEAVSSSPIYSHFGESIAGAVTIRAYKRQQEFIAQCEANVDINNVCYYSGIVANRWVAVRLETIGNMLIFFAALFSVIGRDTLSPGLVGLSVTYALQITANLNWVVRKSSDLESQIVAVERMKEYSETKQEAAWETEEKSFPPDWPSVGKVVFDHYQARYRDGLDLVIKDISCEIQGNEKIGIVGRTGAGKSSLTQALFRIVEPAGGHIFIDGKDISKMGLHDVRSRLTIIPQEPVLFCGNLRMNLDPFSERSDEDLWKALELSHLKSFVKGFNNGLLHEISEGGENLSVGQRQLVCLARALLRKTKILVLDEATAAVDLETDELIQKTIRSEFADCTILTIAHRLNTIMDSTRVMVLDDGKIREFDSPSNLLENRASQFYSMAQDAGLL